MPSAEAYAEAESAKRRRLLDEVCETTGYSRKYASRLLTGNRKFRYRKGRGKTCRGEVLEVFENVWREAGCHACPYFKSEARSMLPRSPTFRRRSVGALVRMSARTISGVLAGAERVKPGWSKANKHSRRRPRNTIQEMISCMSGEVIRASEVPPGDVQVVTFALGGGDASGNFE